MDAIMIAGPCAAESEQQLSNTAMQLHAEAGAKGLHLDFFRAGVWKPRSHPESFAGIGEQALPWLAKIQQQYGTPVCVEVMNPKQLELCLKQDILAVWIGARTAVNPSEVQEIATAAQGTPCTVMVKNPLVPDLKLWIGNIERFRKADVTQVIAIHRGFADSTENVYRNAPCWEIPIDLKVAMPELPIVCDPSHLCGNIQWIPQISQLALNYGFNGLMLECHCSPDKALSDAAQQLTPSAWANLVNQLCFRQDISNNELIKQRALLENVDTQLSTLLHKRMQIVDEIAHIKKKHNLPVVQPKQWLQVRQRYLKNATDEDYRAFVENFLELLHQSSIKRQH